MTGCPIELSVGDAHLAHQNAAVVQACVPLVCTKVPNYNLQRAHDGNPIFHGVPRLSLWDGLRAVRLKLWDEERGRLVTFAEARRANPPEPRRWPSATSSSSATR
jgi:omega-6 fatty acid desaturase (delta-12 desaturase)